MRVHHAFSLSVADELTLEMIFFDKLEQPFGAILPRLAAVQAANHTADFESSIDFIRVGGINGKANNSARKPHFDQAGRINNRQTPPTISAIFTLENRRWGRAEI